MASSTNEIDGDLWDGGRVLAETLASHGVEFIFTVSGGPINPIYFGAVNAGIRVIHVRHESAGGYMADAMSRISGHLGVCVATLGPGAINTMGPVLTAQRASMPVLFIGGQAPASALAQEPGMATDNVSVMRTLTKMAERVLSVDEIGPSVDRAIDAMIAGRPGPAYLEVPSDILHTKVAPQSRREGHGPVREAKKPEELSAASELLQNARRPLALIGDEAYRDKAGAHLLEFVEAASIPFAQLRLARGLLPESHELCIGPGYSPANSALRSALQECDLVLLLGHEFEFDLEFGRGVPDSAKVLQINPIRERLDFNRPADVAVEGSIDVVIPELMASLPGSVEKDWAERVCGAWCQWQSDLTTTAEGGEALHPIAAIDAVVAAAGPDAIFVTSHGNIDFWADARLEIERPASYLRAGQSGALGAEIPYGVSASLAYGDRPVVVFVGDGAAGYHITELDTAARYGAHPTIVVLDDGKWGAIALPQFREFGAEVEMSLPARDWPAMARALGGNGYEAATVEEIKSSIKQAIASGSPSLVRTPVQSVESPYMRYHTGV